MSLEDRIARLERTTRLYQIAAAVMALVLVALFTTGFSQQQSQTYPRNIYADTITVGTLRATSTTTDSLTANRTQSSYVGATQIEAGRARCEALEATNFQAARAAFRALSAETVEAKGRTGTTFAILNESAGFSILSNGSPVALLRAEGDGGSIEVRNSSDVALLMKSGNNPGFSVTKKRRSLATMGVDDRGLPRFAAHTNNGNLGAVLTTDSTGKNGRVLIQEDDGFPILDLDKGSDAGRLRIYGPKNLVVTSLPQP
ncbi:MAG: hypothetical protein KIT11_05330 [Fimbriimonadaceae bacterium]|nr:hypothetical protein [Fimbriimonadaceae bacterium]QYK56686.1 MAG: hypothetical protein KF733_04190 [Fimbriimonadaceae bacterium]